MCLARRGQVWSVVHNGASSLRLRFHAVDQLVAVQVDDIEVAHAVVVVLRRLDHLCAALDELGMHRVDVLDENADGAMAGQPFGLPCGDQVQAHLVTAQAGVERRLAVLKGDVESERVAVIGRALADVGHGEDRRRTDHHRSPPL
jgi:hypothetical protein